MDYSSILKNIKLVATDCDGVLTDGGLYYTENGDIMKRFNVLDGMGFLRLREAGIITAIITAESNPLVKKRADRIKADYLITGTKDKFSALSELCEKLDIPISQAVYIGDDIFDIPAIEACGFGCAPPNALELVKKNADYITKTSGGYGCFREVAEMVLENI